MPRKPITAKASPRSSSPRPTKASTKAPTKTKAAARAKPPAPTQAAQCQQLGAAALRLLAKKSWNELQLRDVARAARIPLPDLVTLCPSKIDLVSLILNELTRGLGAGHVPESGAATHDLLFDVAMSWFEGLAPHKQAVAALHTGLRHDPVTLLCARSGFARVARYLLSLAGADQEGQLGARSLGFGLALFRALPVWLEDEADLSQTMARLDTDLRRAQSVLSRFARQGSTPAGG